MSAIAPLRDLTRGNAVALAALGVGAALAVVAAVRLALPVELPEAAPRGNTALPRLAPRGGGSDDAAIVALLDADPFRSSTVADGGAIAIGGDSATRAPASPPSPAVDVRLQGIAILPGGPRAVLAVAGRGAQLLRPGQIVSGDLRVSAVSRDAVTISGGDTTFVLRLPNDRRGSPAPTQSTVATGDVRPAQP